MPRCCWRPSCSTTWPAAATSNDCSAAPTGRTNKPPSINGTPSPWGCVPSWPPRRCARRPPFLHDRRLSATAIGERWPQRPGWLRFANNRTRAWLYRFALERGYLDAFLTDYIARPFVLVFRSFDRLERKWIAF